MPAFAGMTGKAKAPPALLFKRRAALHASPPRRGQAFSPSKREGDGAPKGAPQFHAWRGAARVWRDALASRRSIAAFLSPGAILPGADRGLSPS